MGDRLPGGLVAGDGEDHEEEGKLLAAQELAVGVGLDEPAGDIPEVPLDPDLGQRVGVGEHLDDAREVGGGVLGVLAARHLVAPVEEPLAIGVGDAHEPGDGLQRQMTGDVDHEVARSLALGRPDDPLSSFAQLVLEACQGARREAAVSHPAYPGMAGWVHAQQEVLGGFARGVGLVEPADEGGIALHRPPRTPVDRRHISVTGDCPEPAVAVGAGGALGIPSDRLVLAQPGEFVTGQMIGQQVGIAQIESIVDRRQGHDGRPPWLTPLGNGDRRL